MMFRCAVFLLFLTIGIARTTDAPTPQALTTPAAKATTAAPATQATTAAPATQATTSAPATQATTAAPATQATTAVPATQATTAVPVANATTVEPATNATTAAPATNATTAAPATNATTVAPATNATTAEPVTNATTVEPVTNATTVEPVTNATTAEPVTNATTAAPVPPTTPTPPLPTPTTGKYNVSSPNGTCLMASFGLRISLKEGEKSQDLNLDPTGTTASGACGADSSDLVLTSDKIAILFTFTTDAKKFQLHSLNVTVKSSSGTFIEANTNLTLWQAALGSSYMCNKQQNVNITTSLTLHTFDLRVQPFEVKKSEFSTAEECFLDSDLSFLVPIAVGVALSFLIILVLISYLIGRRKSRTGYQSV